MKKLTTIITALALLIGTSSFKGSDVSVPNSVATAFQKTFKSVKDVSWKKADAFYFVSFTNGRQQVEAAYDTNGDMVAYLRQIMFMDIPVNLSIALNKKFDGFSFAPMVKELTIDGEIYYFISGENDSRIIDLKCTASGQITVEKKIKKVI